MRLLTPLLIALFLGAAGCKSGIGRDSSPGKTASRPRGGGSSAADDPWWRKNGEAPEPFGPQGTESETDRTASRTQLDSLIAGRVFDESERPIFDAFIQVSAIGDEGKKPIGVNTDRQGLFVIEGLKAGRTYELSARVEDGKRVLGQTVVVRAPNARVLMRVSEAGVSSLTPAAQPRVGESGPFAAPPPEAKPKVRGETIAPTPAPSTGNTKSLPSPDPVGGDPLAPDKTPDYSPSGNSSRGSDNQPPPPPKKSAVDPSLIGNVEDPKKPRPANIPPPNPVPSRYAAPVPSPPPPRPTSPESNPTASNSAPSPRPAPPRPVTASDAGLSQEPSSAPKFDFKIRGVQNDGEWQFSTASGRLVLLDFWSTTCAPCIRALPETNSLAATYTASGLEVVGIACEAPDSFEDQAAGVRTVVRRYGLKYGVYLDGEKNQAQKLFQVKNVPTMILLDRRGNVLWRGTGASRENFDQLEEAIKKGLRRQ